VTGDGASLVTPPLSPDGISYFLVSAEGFVTRPMRIEVGKLERPQDPVRILLSRPLTFMNRSGDAARWLLGEYGLTPESMLVVVDDVDLPLENLRLRRSGGPGTHNGLRDLCDEVGTGFPRLRVGVRGADMEGDLADYVLSPFADDEIEAAKGSVTRAADAVEAALRDGFESAMNAYNRPQQFSTDSASS